MLRLVPLNELPIKSYFQDILHESENLCYHIDDPVVMYVFKIVRYIWHQYEYGWNPRDSSACFLK
jgi:hypothetical protein